jgi:hypothetical protein
MKVEVVIPAARGNLCQKLVDSLFEQTRRPDLITAVGNEADHLAGASILRYRTGEYLMGPGDVCLRRNVGIYASDADIIIFQDDDQMAPPNMVESALTFIESYGYVWGHHRYIDFGDDPWKIVNLPPEIGKSRESEPNRMHLWYSCYAGMMGATRELLRELQGFDMAFQGRHGGEDQQLGRRMLKYVTGSEAVFIPEPPFSWHPTDFDHIERPDNDPAFPYDEVMASPTPVVPFDPDKVKWWRE